MCGCVMRQLRPRKVQGWHSCQQFVVFIVVKSLAATVGDALMVHLTNKAANLLWLGFRFWVYSSLYSQPYA